MNPDPCVVCGSERLAPHLHVPHPDDPELDLKPTTDRYGEALADIVRCLACGHMQLEHFPDDDALARAYAAAASEDYVEEEMGQRKTAQIALDRIERHVTARGRLLDLGCWVGFLVAEAAARGWDAVGVEPSDFAVAYAREHLGLEVLHSNLFDADLQDGSFDAVVMGDVIEHLVRPGDALDRIGRLLAPRGVLYLALPDAGSRLARRMGAQWWSVLPTHVQYFTRSSLQLLLRNHGYRPLHVTTAPKTFSLNYYLWRISGYSAGLSDGLMRAARGVRLAERLWTPDFGDRMAIISRGPR